MNLRSPRFLSACLAVTITVFDGGFAAAQNLPRPLPVPFNRNVPRSTPDPLPLPTALQRAANPNFRVPGDLFFGDVQPQLTMQQREEIQRAQILAWQQVSAALRYLRVNARRILEGNDPLYNRNFGQFYDRSSRNPLLGQYDQEIPAVIAEEIPLGIGDVATDSITFEEDTPYRNNIRIGDRIVVGNQVHVIADLIIEDPMTTQGGGTANDEIIGGIKSLNTAENQQGGGGGGGGGGGNQQNLMLPVPIIEEIVLVDEFDDLGGFIDDTDQLEIRRVVGVTNITNREHYDRVVRTFEAMRDLMELDTTIFTDPEQLEVEQAYNRVFGNPLNLNAQGGGGGQQGTGMQFDPDLPADPMDDRMGDGVDGGDLPPEYAFQFQGRNFDRSFRQFGYSNSDSELAQDRRRLDPENPLRWTEDIARVPDLNLDGFLDGDEPDEEDLLFFRRYLTTFGEFNVGQQQQGGGQNQQLIPGENMLYLGGSFLSEAQDHAGKGIFDASVSNQTLRTDLLQYQMIIAAFSEFSPNFFARDSFGDPVEIQPGAGFGILDVVQRFAGPNGNASLPFPQNMNAESFARFAAATGNPRDFSGIGDGSRLPPAGKNATAMTDTSTRTFPFDFTIAFPFDPIVPIQ